jgi:hypothetical protein
MSRVPMSSYYEYINYLYSVPWLNPLVIIIMSMIKIKSALKVLSSVDI